MVHGSSSSGRCTAAEIFLVSASAYFSITCTNTPPMTAPGSEAMPPTTAPTRMAIDSSKRKLSGDTNSKMMACSAPATPV